MARYVSKMSRANLANVVSVQLGRLGFTVAEVKALVLWSRRLHRHAERCCNGLLEYDDTGACFKVVRDRTGSELARRPARDIEAEALAACRVIIDGRNAREALPPVTFYLQGDPRGCPLYIIPASLSVEEVDARYTSVGVAVDFPA
jgi:hypothetical protein